MTILQDLVRLYDRSPDLPRQGYSIEAIGAEIVLSQAGELVAIQPLTTRDDQGRLRPRRMPVPAPVKRTAGIKPNLLWDKSAYVLGITAALDTSGAPLATPDGAPVPGQGPRTAKEHAAFVATHLELLSGTDVPGLLALCRFLERWQWTEFAAREQSGRHIGQNLVFRLDGTAPFLHDLPQVADMVADMGTGQGAAPETAPETAPAVCLVTGQTLPVARLHPTIKGLPGAQSSGAMLVSFNDPAYESHGRKQGANAPVSDAAAFAYGTALNALLARGPRFNRRLGDTTLVAWADAPTPEAARAAEALWSRFLAPEDDTGDADAARLSHDLRAIADGRWQDVPPHAPETRLLILGLAPNAARLCVRVWHQGRLQDIAAHLLRFHEELHLVPSPWASYDGVDLPPAPWRVLHETAAPGKGIPPAMADAVLTAILTGGPYPRTLLSHLITRMRERGASVQEAQDGRRAAILRAIVTRNTARDVPLRLDTDAEDDAYLLGRLFAVHTYAERSLADRGTTLRDRYMARAAATPARIFAGLDRGFAQTIAALVRAGPPKSGVAARVRQAEAQIRSRMSCGQTLPAAQPLEDQARFFVGVHHQLSTFYAKAKDPMTAPRKKDISE